MKILILEDEKLLAMSMKEYLKDFGYEIDLYENSNDAFNAICEKRYDLLLLDVKVSGEENGFELLRSLRMIDITTPAIFITSLNNIEDLIRGYACGGCDYIRKPFDLTELGLRVEHAIKIYCFKSSTEAIKLPFGYHYDTKKMRLYNESSNPIKLGKTEGKILELLMKNRDSIVTYEMFWEEIWEEWIDPTNIRVQVGNLRKKLKKDFIKNVRGVGYCIESEHNFLK